MLLPEETACSGASKAVLRCLKKFMYVLCTLGFFSQLETTLSTPLSAVSRVCVFRARVLLLYTSLKNPVASGAHCGRRLLWSYSGLSQVSTIKSASYLGLSRVSKEECFVWILEINPRMTENGVFRSDSNFSKKWQKPLVEALKRSEIECLGFTERESFAELIFHLSFSNY